MSVASTISDRTLQLDNLIDGKFVRAQSDDEDAVLNPATEEVIARVPQAAIADLDLAVQAGSRAFQQWGRTTPQNRAALLLQTADAIEEHLEELTELESLDVGKTLAQARGEVREAADIFRFFAGAARCMSGLAAGDYREGFTSMVRREPLGVVGLISPWNFPLMIAAFKMAPALAAGNTVVFKPSEVTPLTTLKFAEIANEIYPAGVVNILTGRGALGSAIAGHPGISMVSFTGGSDTGRSVAREAAGNLKRVAMELGGKAPVVVLDDADVESVVARLRFASFVNSGQACTAACRIIAQGRAYDDLLEALVPAVETIRVGNPADSDVELGPVVSAHQQQRVLGFVKRSGGRVLTGGGAIGEKGFFVQPTVVSEVSQSDEIVQQEIFGPVVTVQRVEGDDADAIALANDVKYGLSGSVWTRDVKRAMAAVQRMDVGQLWVNDHLSSVPEMPNGGFKESGYGSDSSAYGLAEYTRMKHVWIAIG